MADSGVQASGQVVQPAAESVMHDIKEQQVQVDFIRKYLSFQHQTLLLILLMDLIDFQQFLF